MKYLKLFEDFVVNEYLKSIDNVKLYNYLKRSEDDIKNDLPFEYYDYFEQFLEENDIEFETTGNTHVDVDGEETIDEYEDEQLIEWLSINNRILFLKFADWLYEKGLNCELHNDPSWAYFRNPEIVKEQWLVHITNYADEIIKNGFKIGVNDMTVLGLTTYLDDYYKENGGYNFAFTLNDAFKLIKNVGFYNTLKYGKEIIIFRCSGVKVYHIGDEENQVIFFGELATHINKISKINDEWVINDNSKLYHNEKLNSVIKWFTENYNQYKSKLM